MGLSSLMTNALRTTISDDQGTWRQFVLDHLDYIALRSRSYLIDPPLMNLYRYDLKRFLKDYLKRHEDMGWIVQLMNSMKNDFDFVDIENLIVPEDSLLQKLYQSYITVQANSQ